MNTVALRSLASRSGWTALQAALSVITIDQISDSVSIPAPLQWTLVGLAAGLSALKSFVASKVGDSSTVEFTSGEREPDHP